MIAYIQIYTPNINHRQWPSAAVLEEREQDRERAEENRQSIILPRRKSDSEKQLSAAENLEGVAWNFNAEHGSTATCLRQQGLSQVTLAGTVCEPACGSSEILHLLPTVLRCPTAHNTRLNKCWIYAPLWAIIYHASWGIDYVLSDKAVKHAYWMWIKHASASICPCN